MSLKRVKTVVLSKQLNQWGEFGGGAFCLADQWKLRGEFMKQSKQSILLQADYPLVESNAEEIISQRVIIANWPFLMQKTWSIKLK